MRAAPQPPWEGHRRRRGVQKTSIFTKEQTPYCTPGPPLYAFDGGGSHTHLSSAQLPLRLPCFLNIREQFQRFRTKDIVRAPLQARGAIGGTHVFVLDRRFSGGPISLRCFQGSPSLARCSVVQAPRHISQCTLSPVGGVARPQMQLCSALATLLPNCGRH